MTGGTLQVIQRDAGALARIDPHDSRQARPQLAQFGAIVVEQNAHRHTLHDLGEIAGCVLRGMTLN
jgi:hypothetical protein